jgi:NADPH-dependent FMN reductase
MLRVAIITGSTRPGRKGEAVARWVYEIRGSRGDAEFELVDIKDYEVRSQRNPDLCRNGACSWLTRLNVRPAGSGRPDGRGQRVLRDRPPPTD